VWWHFFGFIRRSHHTVCISKSHPNISRTTRYLRNLRYGHKKHDFSSKNRVFCLKIVFFRVFGLITTGLTILGSRVSQRQILITQRQILIKTMEPHAKYSSKQWSPTPNTHQNKGKRRKTKEKEGKHTPNTHSNKTKQSKIKAKSKQNQSKIKANKGTKHKEIRKSQTTNSREKKTATACGPRSIQVNELDFV